MAAGKHPEGAWISSLEEKLDEGDILGILRRTPALLRKVTAGAASGRPEIRTPGNRWSREDILAHLLDTETVMTFRIRKILCEEDPDLSFFDQEKWVGGLRPYRERNRGKLVGRFAVLRADNVALLSSLNEDRMKRTGVHPEAGRMTLEELAARMARHDINHLKQMLAG